MGPRSLEGRVSLVTGAGRGIGRGVALALADAGSAVVLAARSVDQLEELAGAVRDRGAAPLAIPMDVTDDESVERGVTTALEKFGHIDVLVNNAGSNSSAAVGPLWEIDPGAWWHDVLVNLRGTFLCTRAVLPGMVSRSQGHIVNVISTAAEAAWPHDSGYACSKAAVVRLTDSLAEEARGHGVYVFALSPGSVNTELRAGVVDSRPGQTWLPHVSTEPQWVAPETVGQAVTFLAGGGANGLTGRVVHATWDLSELARDAAGIAARDELQLRFRPSSS